MEYQGDIGLYLSGCQVPIKMCGVYITPPKVREIVQFGETDFFSVCQMLADVKKFVEPIKEGNSALAQRSDFQIFIGILLNEETSQVRRMFDSFMQLCFEDFIIDITKKSINFKIDEDGPNIGQINPFNLKEFSQTIRELFLPMKQEDEEIEYNIDKNNQAAVRMLNKIMENRKKRAKAAQEQAGNSTSIFAQYVSILSIGMGVSVNMFYDYTPFQLYDAFSRYIAKMSYDTYQSIITTPFVDSSKIEQVDNWVGDIYKPKPSVYNSMAEIGKLGGSA